MRARLLFPALLAATSLALAGCGTKDNNASSSGAAATASPSASGSSTAAQNGAGTSAVPDGHRTWRPLGIRKIQGTPMLGSAGSAAVGGR